MRGLILRGKVYYARIAGIDGQIIKKRLSTDKRTAVILLGEMRKTIELQRAGILPEKIPEQIKTFEQLRDRYLEHMKGLLADNSRVAFDSAYRQVITKNKIKYISELTTDLVEEWGRARIASGQTRGQTLNTYIILIIGALNWAARNKTITQNPLTNWIPFRKNEPRKRRDMSETEVESILSTEWNDEWRLRWLVYFNTGLRLEAGSALSWDWIDWESRFINLPVEFNKSSKPLPIPINRTLFNALRDYRLKVQPAADGRVFRKVTPRSILRRFKEACEAAQVDMNGVTLHSVRHTVATTLYNKTGKNVKAVQELLGHANAATTMRYLHLTDAEKHEIADTLNFGEANNA